MSLPTLPAPDTRDIFDLPGKPPLDSGYQERVSSGSPERTKRFFLDLIGRWHWIVLGTILGFLAASYQVSKTPKKYTATTTLLVKQRTASLMAKDQTEELDIASAEAFNTIAARICRPELLEVVASRQDVRELPGLVPTAVEWRPDWFFKLTGKPLPGDEAEVKESAKSVPPPAALAGMISGWLRVEIQRHTRLLNISITHPVPEVSRSVADAIAREYLGEIHKARNTGRDSAVEILLKESEDTKKKLEAAQTALAIYSRAVQTHTELEGVEKEVEQLKRRYLPKHPRMIAAEDRLAAAEERFLDAFETARRAASDRVYWETVKDELDRAYDDPKERLKTARTLLLSRSNVLTSEIASRTGMYNSMLTRIQQADINQQGGESEAEVSSFARVPGNPSSPNASAMTTKGSGIGFAIGLAIALLSVRLDNKFHTVAQLEADSGLPVLAAIANISPRHLRTAIKRRTKHIKDDLPNPLREEWDDHLVFRPGASSTSYAEMFRVLRASVSLLGEETKRKISLFTSALPGEGKSTVSANFALAAAGQGRRTVLVDLDLRKPTLHRVFGLRRDAKGAGITECLAGQVPLESVILSDTGEPNLHLILSGKRAPNPGELLNTTRLAELLAELARIYDVIVLDSAPLLAVPDTRVIAPFAHNLCLVVRADYTPKGAVRRCLELLEDGETSPSGLVFNGFAEKRRLIGQNYSYGYYRTNRYGRAYRYGYGAYGAYGEDEWDDDTPKKKKKRKKPTA